MKIMAMAALLGGSILALGQSGDPSGVHYWSHDDLQKMTTALAPQIDAHGLKSQTIVTEGNHRFLISHREGIGQSEYHATEEDIVYVQSGHASLTYGGKMVGAQETGPGEQRGSAIDGGQKKLLGPGDVVAIPAGIPHQFSPVSGEPFNYFVVKVTEQKAADK